MCGFERGAERGLPPDNERFNDHPTVKCLRDNHINFVKWVVGCSRHAGELIENECLTCNREKNEERFIPMRSLRDKIGYPGDHMMPPPESLPSPIEQYAQPFEGIEQLDAAEGPETTYGEADYSEDYSVYDEEDEEDEDAEVDEAIPEEHGLGHQQAHGWSGPAYYYGPPG
jgi:hypothetical protein